MTIVYQNVTSGRVNTNPEGRDDTITGVYDDVKSGGDIRIFRVDGKAGDVIQPYDMYGKFNQGRTRGFQYPSRTVVLLSGRRVIEDLDDDDNVVGTQELNTGNRFSAYGRGATGRAQSHYLEDTSSYCIMSHDRDITDQQNGSTPAGGDIPMTGGENVILAVWSGSASFDGTTYAAPVAFYGTVPRGDIPLAVTDCEWVRLLSPRRTGA